jgi:hypothetical protein
MPLGITAFKVSTGGTFFLSTLSISAILTCYFSRYRRVPTFGRGTIRRFCNNAASMKKLAARDFEDLLQV